MNEEEKDHKAKKGGPPNQGSLQAYIQNFSIEAMDEIVKIMRTSRNESLRFGAARAILDKSVADLKSVELGGEIGADGRRRAIELLINVGGGFLPPTFTLPASSAGGTTAISSSVQGSSLAPEGEEDIHSNNGDSQAGTS